MSDSNVSTPASGRSVYSEGGAVETRLIYEATVSVFLERETDRPDPEWQSLDGGISTLGIYQSFHPEYPFRLLAISVQSNEVCSIIFVLTYLRQCWISGSQKLWNTQKQHQDFYNYH